MGIFFKKMVINILISVAILSYPVVSRAFCFKDAGRMYEVSPMLLEAIAYVESNNDPLARGRNSNGTRDYGLMQVNSFWAKTFGNSWNLVRNNPCYNVIAGAWILRGCVDRYGKRWDAVECYHAGRSGKEIGKRYVKKVQRVMAKLREKG